MRRNLRLLTIGALFVLAFKAFAGNYDLDFSTFIGGTGDDMLRDIATDREGNIYITGGTNSPDFPVTAGAYDTTYHGNYDVFVTKLDSTGSVIWSTYIGTPEYDRAYGIELDSENNVYVTGRAGRDFPVTPGVVQPDFRGYQDGVYGWSNSFVAELSADGSQLVWSSHLGVYAGIRDFAIDRNGDLYVSTGYGSNVSPDTLPPEWVANAFQRHPQGDVDGVIAKVKSDGTEVLWATYLGGTGGESGGSIRVDSAGCPCVVMSTTSTDIPVTPNAFDTSYNGGGDYYIAKLSADGSQLVFGTYLGGSAIEYPNTHNLELDRQGNVYVACATASPDFPVTPGVFQPDYGGGSVDGQVSKLSSDGTQLLLSTYLGGSDFDAFDGIAVDSEDNVSLSGQCASTDFPVTPDAFQDHNRGHDDGLLVKVAADFTHLLYSTYMGADSSDFSRSTTLDSRGCFYYAGWTRSDSFPLLNPHQSQRAGGYDAALARFRPSTSAIRQTATELPARTEVSAPTIVRGVLRVPVSPFTIHASLFDMTGRRVTALRPGPNDMSCLAPGVYFVREAQARAQAQAIRKVVLAR